MCLRYCAVCHPYTYRDLTQTSSVSKRVSLYIVPVLLFSVILNIPKFFETRIVYSKGKISLILDNNGQHSNF